MKHNNLLIIVAVIVLITATILFGCKQKPVDNTIRVGVILPLTGDSAYMGVAFKSGMDLALEQYEQKRAAEKLPEVKIFYEDSMDLSKNAVSAYQKLKSIDKVDMYICVSGGWKALIPLANADKKVLFCSAVSPSKVTEGSDWTFRFYTSADADAALMAKYAIEKLALQKIGILYVNDDFGSSYKDVFSSVFTEGTNNAVITEGFNPSDSDFRTVLAKFKTQKIDGLYLLGYGTNMGLVPKQMKEIGLNATFLSIGTISLPDVMQLAGNSINGTFYTTTKFNAFMPETKELIDFVGDYKTKYNQQPMFFEVFGFDSFNILASVFKNSGKDSDKIRQGLLAVKNYKAAVGEVSFDDNREASFPLIVRQIRNGELVDAEW
ncbi:MAG: ABC transporter substrate-binding protein [Candidatus Cloacimonetes bacterium]|nr:ABC transporter substrate-binding protein [Candidatus Cloacimonadota bacterium]